MELALQFIFAGVTYGMMYAIVAIGFNIIYNTTGIINFAQGEFVMLGGLLMVWLSVSMGLPMPLAFIITIAVVMVIGALFERFKDPKLLDDEEAGGSTSMPQAAILNLQNTTQL